MIWLLGENPRTLQVCGDNITGLIFLNNSRIAAKRCHYNTGGYMTLAELGMAFWHDLAAPLLAFLPV